MNIGSLKLSTSGMISLGTNVTVEGNGDTLETGTWTVSLLYKNNGGTIAQQSVLVPDFSNTPGVITIMKMNLVSSEEIRINFPTTSPAIAFPFCVLKVKGPDGLPMSSTILNGTLPIHMSYNTRTTISVVNVAGSSIISPNDYIDIESYPMAFP